MINQTTSVDPQQPAGPLSLVSGAIKKVTGDVSEGTQAAGQAVSQGIQDVGQSAANRKKISTAFETGVDAGSKFVGTLQSLVGGFAEGIPTSQKVASNTPASDSNSPLNTSPVDDSSSNAPEEKSSGKENGFVSFMKNHGGTILKWIGGLRLAGLLLGRR